MNGSSVSIKTGVEGPDHDPYSYDEITVERADGRKAMVHLGLGVFVDIYVDDGSVYRIWPRVDYSGLKHDESPDDILLEVVGVTINEAERAFHGVRAAAVRRHRSHGAPRSVRGYPGETFTMCPCGAVLDSHFNEAAII